MAVRCSAKQIADSVVLWGMAGTFPEYCECAEDARRLKSLDLIISTLDVFIEAFSFSFIDIYRKYKVNLPLPEEKFIEFLKPRCLLLTKDNKFFNFMLVCAFVYEIIHSFSYYNNCFHLVKVASKCLAAILKNRFKKIFETDSDWEELMSFCIKMHCLVHPPEKIYESDGIQLIGVVNDNMDASFPNMAQGLAELSVEKHATDDNNDDDSDAKMAGKKNSTSLKNDLNIEIEGKELEYLCNLEFPTSTGAPHTLQLIGEGFLKSENKEKIVNENNAGEDNEKDYVTDSSLPDLAEEFTNMVISNKEGNEKLDEMTGFKKTVTLYFEDYLAIKEVTERLEDLCNLRLPSTGAPHTQLKVEDSSTKEAEDKEKIYDGNDARKDNEKDCATNMTDSSLPELTKEFTDMTSEKMAINNNKEGNEKLDEMTGFKKTVTIYFEDYLAIKKMTERLEDLCNLRLPSTGAPHTQLKVEDSSTKEAEDKKKLYDGNDARKDNEKDCVTDMTDSSLPELAKEFTDIVSEKTPINNNKEDNEKFDEMTGYMKNVTRYFDDYLVKKVTERLEDLCNLGLPSTGASHTLQLKVEDSSPKEENKEKICNENDGKNDNEKDCLRELPMMDSSMSNLAQDITNTTINNKDGGTEKLGQMIGFKKHLTLSFGKDLAVKKVPEKLHLCNLGPDSSTGASHTFLMKGEGFSPNAESEDKENVVDESNAKDGNENVTDSLIPDLAHELTKIFIEMKAINKNVNGAEKPGQTIGCRKKSTLPFSKDSSAQNAAKKLAGLSNLESASSTDVPHTLQLKDKEFSSKNESEDNEEPFDIRCMSRDKVRARITDNPQQLSEIMSLLKKCEDIEPNHFSPDEYNIPMNDGAEDEGELEASGGTLEGSSNSDQKTFESSIKTTVFIQNMRTAHAIIVSRENNLSDDKSPPKASGGEAPHKMSDEVVYGNGILESEDPLCSLCAGGMINFFDACVNNFPTKYSNNNHVTDLLSFDFNSDSE